MSSTPEKIVANYDSKSKQSKQVASEMKKLSKGIRENVSRKKTYVFWYLHSCSKQTISKRYLVLIKRNSYKI